MAEIRRVQCDVKGCESIHVEQRFNEGFPCWGEVRGLINSDTGEAVAHICPKHMRRVKELLDGELD